MLFDAEARRCRGTQRKRKSVHATSVAIELASPRLPEIAELIRESDTYAQSLYPPESNHLVDIDGLTQANVIFCVARLDGKLSGCGAAVIKPEGYAEIKRMFVRANARGRGLGRQILEFLEGQVRTEGVTLTRLETGVHSYEAIALYERLGYVKISPFGDYWDDPLSVFFEKQL